MNVHSCIIVKSILDEFCNISGQNINFHKSKNFLSPNCTKQRFNGILRMKSTSRSPKYLGIELGKMKSKRAFLLPLMEKFQQRLARWKSQLLSQGGRLTLIKSTLASLPNYCLSCFKAPMYICKKFDLTIRCF